jgi:chromate reductase
LICIISGTNRPGSRTLQVSREIELMYHSEGQKTVLLSLESLDMRLVDGSQYSEHQPEVLRAAIETVNAAEGLVIVCPEYNGSYPGILKYFIDHWSYPLSFEARPVAFVGLGGRFGGLRPVEHLQGVFGYRNAYIFPERVFLLNVFATVKDGKILDTNVMDLLKKQTQGFVRFIQGLKDQRLHTNVLTK